MPKLNTDQIIERLERRIAELEVGEEIAKKDIYALLTDAQQQSLESALSAQAQLKKEKRARSEDEKQALGWKTIREVRLDALRNALSVANAGLLTDYERRQRAAEIRQTKIYFAAIEETLDNGKDIQGAKTWANNELTRAGLARMDGQRVKHASARDKEVKALEDALRAQFKSQMTAEEREQQKMLEDLDKPANKRKNANNKSAIKGK